jgi:RNA polymerase sigma factor for flagellar operon FliA
MSQVIDKKNAQSLFDPKQCFDAYWQSKDSELRNQLVLHYSYIAKSVAMQMRGIFSRYAQIEDIVQQGMITLIDCVEKFDPSKEVKFESYAFMRVKGAVIDFVRKQDWVPRRVRKTARDIALATEQLSNQLMREPTEQEIMDYLDISEAELKKNYHEISTAVMLSFEAILENSAQWEPGFGMTQEEMNLPEGRLFQEELRQVLIEAIDSLTERERLVVSLYYYERLRFSDIAKVLEVSESRVCQIHTKVILKLKESMEAYMKG